MKTDNFLLQRRGLVLISLSSNWNNLAPEKNTAAKLKLNSKLCRNQIHPVQGRGRAGLGQGEGNRGKCQLRKGTRKGKRYMQPHQKHILWPQKHTESQVPSCILGAKKEPGSQPLQAGKIKIKDDLVCPLMTGLITDFEDVFRLSLLLAFTPTLHSVPTVTSSSPPENKTKSFSVHQFAVRVQGAQQLSGP